MYYKTQDEIKRRRKLAKIDGSKYTNRYAFSGKLYCSLCGSRFVGGDNRKRADGTTRKSWHCYNRHKYGKKRTTEAGVTLGCDNEIVSDNALKLVFMDILKQLNLNAEKITNDVAKAISSIIDKRCIEEDTKENLIKKKNQLLEEKNKAINLCIKEVITEEELKEQKQFIDNQITDIEKEIKNLENKNETIQNKATILKEIKEVITGIASLQTFSDEVCKEIVEKVEVKDKTHFDFYIRGKSGNFFSASEGNILYGKYEYGEGQNNKNKLTLEGNAFCVNEKSGNLIQNGDFSQGFTGWEISNCDGNDKVEDGVYKFIGDANWDKNIHQQINQAGKKGDIYNLAAWVNSRAVQHSTEKNININKYTLP